MRKDAEKLLHQFDFSLSGRLYPSAKYCSMYSHKHKTDVITVKEHIERGVWVALDQNGEAIKSNAPNKLKK